MAILTGGRARRFGGRDKASLVVGGRTIIERQVGAVFGLTPELLIVVRDAAAAAGFEAELGRTPTARGLVDLIPGAGPLGGIYTAAISARTEQVLVLACDMPFVTRSFLEHLIGTAERTGAGAMVPSTPRGLEPLCAVYGRRATELAEQQIASGDLRLTTLLNALDAQLIPAGEIAAFDRDGSLFFNVNTPDDYAAAVAKVSES